jgi:acyl carrier protein
LNAVSRESVRRFVAGHVAGLAGRDPVVVEAELAWDYDLFLTGTVDSLGLVGLIAALQQRFGDQIDFEIMDPEEMTIVGPLCAFVVENAGA